MRLSIAAAATLLVAACATAMKPTTPEIAARQELMRSNKAALIELGKITSGEAPWSAEAAQRSATTIMNNAAAIPALTGKGTGPESGRTRARPAIWNDFDGFERAAWNVEDLAQSIVTLARAGDEASVRARVTRLEKDCDACHMRFMFPEFPR
jgi:cytochrome c556